MIRDKVPFNRAGKIEPGKDTFAQKEKHLATMASELERGRVTRHMTRGFTKKTEPSENVGSNRFPAKPQPPKTSR